MAVILTKDQVKELKEQPQNAHELKRARNYQSRIKFHTQPQDELIHSNHAYSQFVTWVKSRIPVEKFNSVQKLIKTPISTTSLTGEIYNHFTKIFHASDSNREVTVKSESLKEDVKEALQDSKTFFEKKVFEKVKFTPCDFVSVLLPEEEGLPFPEFIDLDCVIDAQVDEEANVDYIIFKHGEDKTCVIDGEGWKVYEGETLTEVMNVPHGLPYAPVRQLWNSNLNDNCFVKEVPISKSLGKLDFLLWKEISREYAETYAEYPIIWMYESDEDYHDYENLPPQEGQITSGATASVLDAPYINESGNKTYPNTPKYVDNKKLFDGAGGVIYKSYPKENERDIGEPAGFISADVVSLNYIKENIEDRISSIYTAATGQIQEFKNDTAKNEKQINSQFESSRSIMIEFKTNFELLEKWITDTIGLLVAGESYEGSSINYGTNFFLQTVNSIEEGIKFSKDNGLSEGYIGEQYKQLINTKHKHDPLMKKRAEILFALEPFPTIGIVDAYNMAKDGLISREDWELKKNFNTLIAQYEAKKVPVDMLEVTDVDKIKKELKEFITVVETPTEE